eukprot:3511196-Rhodomonas_salina.2
MVYVTDESMRHEITSWCRTSRIILRLGYEMSGTDLVPSCISCYSIAMRCPGLSLQLSASDASIDKGHVYSPSYASPVTRAA